jgi:hypothetical protein
MMAKVRPGSGKKVEEIAKSSCNSDEVRAVHAIGEHGRSGQLNGIQNFIQRLTYLGIFHLTTAMVLD